ncbi:MAG: hypothetical protein ABUL44_05005 [Flavobacterium sp.]
MEHEILDNLILLGLLHDHHTAKMQDYSAQFVNMINQISVKILNQKEILVGYNFYDQNIFELLPSDLIYDFFEELLLRENANKVNVKYGNVIEVFDWKEQLKPNLVKIQSERSYDRYLKNLTLTSLRFETEYFDGIVIVRDKENELRTNVLKLKSAIEQCI